MATGTLKMWNADRGFGFIKDDSGGSACTKAEHGVSEMKHQRHFEKTSDVASREADQIRTLIANLERTVQILDCDIATEDAILPPKKSARGCLTAPMPHIRSSPGRWQRDGTI